jgi:hypothetical protein
MFSNVSANISVAIFRVNDFGRSFSSQYITVGPCGLEKRSRKCFSHPVFRKILCLSFPFPVHVERKRRKDRKKDGREKGK